MHITLFVMEGGDKPLPERRFSPIILFIPPREAAKKVIKLFLLSLRRGRVGGLSPKWSDLFMKKIAASLTKMLCTRYAVFCGSSGTFTTAARCKQMPLRV